jgi:hypothetical protein
MTQVVLLEKQIKERIARLEKLRFGLECSDDRLFLNYNGNLSMYNQWGYELELLKKQLKEHT